MNKSAKLTKDHEQCLLRLYRDSLGVWTIGWGTNIESITQAEADYLFESRFNDAVKEAKRFSWYADLNEARQAVIENMIYNMGIGRFKGFQKFIAAVDRMDYQDAKHQMLYNSDGSDLSPWAKQVGYRAQVLAEMMLTGQWMEDRHK